MLQRQTGEVPSDAAVARLRQQMRLDDPLPQRYGRWLASAAQGDLGRSYRSGESVAASFVSRLPATLQLAVLAIAGALLLSVPLGVLAAHRHGSLTDHGVRLAAVVGASLPSFWVGYLLIWLVGVQWQWLPIAGRGGVQHAILPAATLALGAASLLTRLARSSVLTALAQPSVQQARALGLPEWQILWSRALRGALVPIVTITGVRFGQLVGGAAIVETVFAWPGIGRLLVEAVFDRDHPVIQGYVLLSGTAFVLLHLAVDVVCAAIDPRLRNEDRDAPS